MNAGYPPNGGRLVRFLNNMAVEPDVHAFPAIHAFSAIPFRR